MPPSSPRGLGPRFELLMSGLASAPTPEGHKWPSRGHKSASLRDLGARCACTGIGPPARGRAAGRWRRAAETREVRAPVTATAGSTHYRLSYTWGAARVYSDFRYALSPFSPRHPTSLDTLAAPPFARCRIALLSFVYALGQPAAPRRDVRKIPKRGQDPRVSISSRRALLRLQKFISDSRSCLNLDAW